MVHIQEDEEDYQLSWHCQKVSVAGLQNTYVATYNTQEIKITTI